MKFTADVDAILDELKYFRVPFPSAAVAAAIERKSETTPRLLQILEQAAEHPAAFGEEERCDHIFALYLLAKFREERAWPLVVRIASAPDGGEEILGDVVVQSLAAIIASVYGTDLGGIKALIENVAIYQWVRVVAVEAMVKLVAVGIEDRDETMQYFAGLFHTLERKPGEVWIALANACLDLYPEEVTGEIRRACQDRLIEEGAIDESDTERALALGKDGALDALRAGTGRQTLIDDVDEEMSWMGGFHDDPVPAPLQGAETVVRSGPKVGRNDPCPCGSGKKYKKCCAA